MKTVGIIAEYNPFHRGHRYLIENAKRITGAQNLIVVMSENAVQRGDFALVDQFLRAEAAISGGANLVIGLSFCYSAQSAEYFAEGATKILEASGVVDYLCYGSEHNDLESQIGIAKTLNEKKTEILSMTRELMKEGISYPRAREQATRFFGREDYNYEIMGTPNDILAIEYLKSLDQMGSKIQPLSIKRVGADHNDQNFERGYPSASAIRKILLEEKSLFSLSLKEEPINPNLMQDELVKVREMEIKTLGSLLPEKLAENLLYKRDKDSLNSIEKYFDEIRAIIISRKDELEEIFEIGEGVDNAIFKNIYQAKTIEELAIQSKSKRFTYTRLRRILLNILVGLKKADMEKIKLSDEIPYSRILAFDDRGRNLLKEIKVKEGLELINKVADFKPEKELHKLQWKYDTIIDELYYSKYECYYKGKRVHSRSSISPSYIKE